MESPQDQPRSRRVAARCASSILTLERQLAPADSRGGGRAAGACPSKAAQGPRHSAAGPVPLSFLA